jgi:hypothetical protein
MKRIVPAVSVKANLRDAQVKAANAAGRKEQKIAPGIHRMSVAGNGARA